MLYCNPFSWDIANDPGDMNNSFGSHEGAQTSKWYGVRHPHNPEYYDFDHNGNHLGFGQVTQEILDNHPAGYEEQVNQFLERSVRWLIHTTIADGVRLDAVKHVRAEFFGADGAGKDESDYGYTGQIQWQFNQTHGFTDSNHRDSMFNPDFPRDDAMLFGEQLGAPPAEQPDIDRGMRLANDDYLNAARGIGNSLAGFAERGFGIFGGEPHSVAYDVMSHDNNDFWGGDRPQAFPVLLAREGLPIIYTDGYNESRPPDWFPEPAQVPFLGQFGERWITHPLFIRRHFGWGGHWPIWDAWDKAAWIRSYNNDHEGTAMVFVQIKNYLGGAGRTIDVAAPFNEGDVLYQYGTWGRTPVRVQDGRFRTLSGNPIWVGDGDYAVFSWRIPEMPAAWRTRSHGSEENIQPITILQGEVPAETIWVPRRDGRDGDAAFNPYGLPIADEADRTYLTPIPRVTQSSNITFQARVPISR